MPSNSQVEVQVSANLRPLLHALGNQAPEALEEWLSDSTPDASFLDQLDAQRVAPYLYYRLHKAGLLATVPQAGQVRLRTVYSAAVACNLLYSRELGELLTRLRALSVEPIVLKGMVLGRTVYPTAGCRPTSDIDLLVERAEMPAVRQVLAGRGYQDHGLAAEHHLTFNNHLHAWRRLPGDNVVDVEAHWSLSHDPGYARESDLASLRAQTQVIDFGGFAVRALDPVDQLIHACEHLL